jgi:Ion transport protein
VSHPATQSPQILTLEDWAIVTHKIVDATNWGAAVFLLAWIVVGHYVFLTLFLAVILESFESKYDEEAGTEAYIASVVNDVHAQQNSLLAQQDAILQTTSTADTAVPVTTPSPCPPSV